MCIVGGFYLSDLYSQLRVRSKSQLLQQVCFVLGVAFLIQSLLDYLRLTGLGAPEMDHDLRQLPGAAPPSCVAGSL